MNKGYLYSKFGTPDVGNKTNDIDLLSLFRKSNEGKDKISLKDSIPLLESSRPLEGIPSGVIHQKFGIGIPSGPYVPPKRSFFIDSLSFLMDDEIEMKMTVINMGSWNEDKQIRPWDSIELFAIKRTLQNNL